MHTLSHEQAERLARRRAGAKLGWYIHAFAYLAVNLLLLALSSLGERSWAVYPAFGWAIGLAVHGVVVFALTGGAMERLVQRERERLSLQRDPW